MTVFRAGPLDLPAIIEWLHDLRGHVSSQESGYDAMAVCRAGLHPDDPFYFGGVNIENCDHALGLHAEESTLCAALTGLGRQVRIYEMWVMGGARHIRRGQADPALDSTITCCGRCRQQMAGLVSDGAIIHYLSLSGRVESHPFSSLLPHPYTFRQYIAATETAAPAVPRTDRADAHHIRQRLIRISPLQTRDIRLWLEGLSSIDDISRISQSVVFRLANGAYVAGTRMEDAALVAVEATRSALAVSTAEFGASAVAEVWVHTHGRNGHELAPDQYGTLPMSGLQTLLQVAASPDIPLHFFSGDGQLVDCTLLEAARLAPTSQRPLQNRTH